MDKQEAIKHKAYKIWESEGRPQGRDQEHWNAAEAEVSEPSRLGTKESKPKPASNTEKGEAVVSKVKRVTKSTGSPSPKTDIKAGSTAKK